MNKQKMEELIDLLDDTIQEEKEFVGPEDAEEYRQSQIRIFNFNEIKGIVEGYMGEIEFERVRKEQEPPPDDKCEYFLSNGTCVCRYCGSVLGDEWEDK